MLSVLAMVTRGHKNKTSHVAARRPGWSGPQAFWTLGLPLSISPQRPSNGKAQLLWEMAFNGKVSHSLDVEES